MSSDEELDETGLISILERSDKEIIKIKREKTFTENLLDQFNYIEGEDPTVTLYRKKKFLRDEAAKMVGPDPLLLSKGKYKETVLGVKLNSNDIVDMIKEIESYQSIFEQLRNAEKKYSESADPEASRFPVKKEEEDSIEYYMPIACFTCGKRVSMYENIFDYLYQTNIRKKYILDYLKMDRACCREKFEKTMSVPRKLYPEELLNEQGTRGINMNLEENANSVHVFNVLKDISVGTISSTQIHYINKSYTPLEKGARAVKTDSSTLKKLEEMEAMSTRVERKHPTSRQTDNPTVYLSTEARMKNGELGSMIFCGMLPSGPVYTWRLTGAKYEAR